MCTSRCVRPNLTVADLCICLQDWEPGGCRKTLLCTGRSRSQRCCRCTSDTLLSGGCSCQPHWGLCCRYTDMDGTVSRAHCCPEGLQSSRHHRAHISCLGTRESEGKEERPEALLLWMTNGDILSSLAITNIQGLCYTHSGSTVLCQSTEGKARFTAAVHLGESNTRVLYSFLNSYFLIGSLIKTPRLWPQHWARPVEWP